MKILLITISARGHAIAEALKRSPQNPQIIHVCPTRNPGIRPLAEEQFVVDSLMDFPAILEIAKRTLRPRSGQASPDFAFVAPDDPIGGGLADELDKIGIPSVAPKKTLARIESSKGFARELWRKYGIEAAPRFRVFRNGGEGIRNWELGIRKYLEEDLGGNYVVKYDGLLGGKGVKVSGEHLLNIDEGVAYALECLEKSEQVVIEEKLIGCEFSLMSFVSGTQVVSMPAVQDHKRAFAGDTGPNTGGMGSYSDANHSLPFLRKDDIEEAHELNVETARALQKECGEPYKGILYGGFIATAGGVKLIEYNARFGDPEALNVLPILKSDFVAICQAVLSQELNTKLVQFEQKATVCKYIVPVGYPDNKNQRGEAISLPSVTLSGGPPDASSTRFDRLSAPLSMTGGGPETKGRIYYGDVSEDPDGTLRLGGSRTAGIVGIGDTIAEAEKIADDLCKQVKGPVRYREDIGTAELIGKRIEMMKM